MQGRFARTLALLLAGAGFMLAEGEARAAPIQPGAMRPVAKVDPRFQSYNVEMAELVGGRFWAPYPKAGVKSAPQNTERSGGLDLAPGMFRQRQPLDLKNNRLRNLAAALGPAYIRISGSWANTVFFQDDDLPRIEKPPAGFQNVLTRAQWAGAVGFAKAVDAKIVTSFPVSAGAREANGAWNPDQAARLVNYTRELGGEIYAAELVNEPNIAAFGGLPRGYDASAFARDVAAFRTFAAREAPGLKTVGPGSTGESGSSSLVKRGIPTNALMSAEPRPRFDIFSYHFYGAASQRCARSRPAEGVSAADALSEEWLARTDAAFGYYGALRDRYMPGAPIWLTETAQASCGGDAWAVSFLDSFRYVDQMGRLAKLGVSAVFHNTLAASDYGLIEEDTWTPRPNYWTALLWSRLMGETVLDAGPTEPGLHVYAHCLRGHPGGVALVALNLDRAKAVNWRLPTAAERYTLSADGLQSSSAKLNGRTLRMAGDQLPVLRPAQAAKGPMKLEPTTITFLAMPKAANPACS